jgi:hypothetical protein
MISAASAKDRSVKARRDRITPPKKQAIMTKARCVAIELHDSPK